MFNDELIESLIAALNDPKYRGIRDKFLTKGCPYELGFAYMVGMHYVNKDRYDVITKKGRKLELKYCSNMAGTIAGIDNKEDILIIVKEGIIDDNVHFFLVPKAWYSEKYGCNKFNIPKLPKDLNNPGPIQKEYFNNFEITREEISQL